MFYNRGEVLSDQFDHFKLILFWVPDCSFCKKKSKNGMKWEFFPARGLSPIPTSTNHYTTQKVNIFVKIKNDLMVLKCKINYNLFPKHGVPTLRGGCTHFFSWKRPLIT